MEKSSDQRDAQPLNETVVTKAQALAPELAFVAIIGNILPNNSDLAWQNDALCPQIDHDSFFPERGGSVSFPKKVCDMCTVKDACLEFALDNDIQDGVWGGLSFNERERERSRRERRAS